jgi:two-component system, OmpR family, response regulator CpxR
VPVETSTISKGANGSVPERATILCVDDEEMALSVRKLVLESEGYIVLAAPSAAQGIELFKANQVDLVITDHLLPGATGSKLAEKLREISPNVPVMILSGAATLDLSECPPDYCLHKLQGPTEMMAKVRLILTVPHKRNVKSRR